MKIGIVARIKQGDLLEALQKRSWSQKQAAEFLGIDQGRFGGLINMNAIPDPFPIELELKLHELTGKTAEELFPEFIRTKEFKEAKKTRTVFAEITQQTLEAHGLMHQLPAPAEVLSEKELNDEIAYALHMLTPREEKIVRAHYFEDKTLDEISQEFQVDELRIKQIAEKAMRKLRGEDIADRLRGHFPR